MPLVGFFGILLLILAIIALLPLTLIQRYRVGTARQQGRRWLATLNLLGITVSTAMFLIGAGLTSIWIPGALTYSLGGLAAGCALGVIGLLLTRWEPSPRALHYTPNRWLVLAITLLVTARLIYGFWRGWQSWRAAVDDSEWLAASGAAGALAAGAVVLGYYLVYWAGVRRRLTQHDRRALRTMRQP